MIASILSALSFALMAGAFVIMHLRVKELEDSDTDKRVENLINVAKAQNKTISEMDKDLDKLEVQSSYNEEAIEKIVKQLEDITKDIKRLDELTEKDHKNLVDIRQRYILWREPGTPVISGVPWAKEQKCFDDMTTEEKIHEWEDRAATYKSLGLNVMEFKLAYEKCLDEIKKLKSEEGNE